MVVCVIIATGLCLITEENLHPEFSRENASKLEILPFIEACWDLSPDLRPGFKKIVKTMTKIYSGN